MAVARRKIQCPVCQVEVAYLPQHMRKVHKWSPTKAKTVVADFDLCKCRDLFPTDKRVRKPDVRKCRFMCNYEGCRKEVKRVGNHLRQKHNLKGEAAKKVVLNSTRISLSTEMLTESSASSSEEEEQQGRVNLLSCYISEDDSSDDPDWAMSQYSQDSCADSFKKYEKRVVDDDDDDDISCFDADNSSDDNKSFSSVSDDEYDYEDSNNVDFVMSSVQQDVE